MTRCLCMCSGGHVRSVTLARLLHKRGLEALVCGVYREYSAEAIHMLCDWAEVIFIQADAKSQFEHRFGPGSVDQPASGPIWLEETLKKMDLRFDVGPDDWKVPQADSLLMLLRQKVEIAFDDPTFVERMGLGRPRP